MSAIELPSSLVDARAGALVPSPPPRLSPMLPLRTAPLCTVRSKTQAGPSTGLIPCRILGGGPSSALVAYKEHAAVLKDHLVAVEDSLDTVPPEDHPATQESPAGGKSTFMQGWKLGPVVKMRVIYGVS
ncbi:hypothetical protein MRX96_008386 [Rhipicephalus microplus]